MVTRMADGSAGDANYATIGEAYTHYRRPDPRIAARVTQALGAARTELNVGAGAGSYEPADRQVTPVEPSASMRAQRPAWLAAAVDATAEDLPYPDGFFDAAMTTFSVHQWGDLRTGLREVRRARSAEGERVGGQARRQLDAHRAVLRGRLAGHGVDVECAGDL